MLSEGQNTIGSAQDNDHVFPINTPTHLGYVEVRGEMVSFVDGSNARHQLSVLEGTVVSFGDFEFYMLKREKGFAIRLIENNAEKINRESEIAIQTCNNNETSEYEKEKKLAQKKYPEIWNLLNEESKDYIAGAELLFNLIHKSELKEFSSFILYYSKALENEISEKIFKKFIEKLISKKVDFENIFKITPPNKNFGKGFNTLTLDTVKGFFQSGKKSKFKI